MRKFFFSLIFIAFGLSLTAQPAVKWHTLEEAAKLNAKSPRKIFLDLYTDWCGWCKTLDKNTFSNPEVANYLNTHFYPVKMNAEGKDPIEFKGETYKFNAQYRTHDLAIAFMQGKMSYPTTAYMDENLQMITTVPGYQSPEDMLPILVFFAENYYQRINWEEFQKQWPQLKKARQQ